MRTSGSACLERSDDGRKSLLDDQRLHRGVAQDVDLLRHRQPPVERHQQGAEPRAGIEQHQVVGMVGGQDGDPIARAHAQLRFQRARGLADAPGEVGIRQGRAGKPNRGLVRGERRVALDEVGEVHGVFWPSPIARGHSADWRAFMAAQHDIPAGNVMFQQRAAEKEPGTPVRDGEAPSPKPPEAVYLGR